MTQSACQRLSLQGLGNKVIHACRQSLLAFFLHGCRCKSDDGSVSSGIPFSNLPGYLEAVQHRHVQVQKYYVGPAFAKELERLCPILGFQNLSMWIPVDPVPREVTLEFVAGSHLGPMYLPRTFLDARAAWFPEGSLAEAPDIDATAHQDNVLGWQLEPGDAVCFHMNTLHTAAGNPGPHRRRVLSLRFLGDDMRHVVRPWTTSPPFPGLADELPDGAPLDHPSFPVLWRST